MIRRVILLMAVSACLLMPLGAADDVASVLSDVQRFLISSGEVTVGQVPGEPVRVVTYTTSAGADWDSIDSRICELVDNMERPLTEEEVSTIVSRLGESLPTTYSLTSADIDAIAVRVHEMIEEEEAQLAVEEEKELNNGFFFDGWAHATLLRKADIVPGGTIALGWKSGNFLTSAYARFDYFLKPLGSSTGRYATLELAFEPGISVESIISSQGTTDVKLSLDFGYYIQLLERSGQTSVFHISYNGLMLRPTLAASFDIGFINIEAGIYYQTAVYPRYSDYDGFGVYLKLF